MTSLWRRLVPAILVAAVLGAGGAALVARSDAHPSARPSPSPSPTVDDVAPVAVTGAPSSVPSWSAPASPRPSRTPATRIPAPSRTPSASPSRVPLYRPVTGDLCTYVDFSAITAINTRTWDDGAPHVGGSTAKAVGDGTANLCKGYAGNTTVRSIFVEVFPSRASALSAWASEKSTDIPAGADVFPGVGDDDIGFYLSDPDWYKLDVQKDNVWLYVVLAHALPMPTAAAFKAAFVATARSILAKLPRQ